ncbi:MAG: hypothetical protein OER86_02765 [Phycisphaerae bacterium]|nr:hypothetical protein [Phycisphaerae bacterium]
MNKTLAPLLVTALLISACDRSAPPAPPKRSATAKKPAPAPKPTPPPTDVLYNNDFENDKVGAEPEAVMVLDGAFAVTDDQGNKILRLPGEPLDTFGVLLGPAAREDVTIRARVRSHSTRRRFPSFAVGLASAGGYKLRLATNRDQLEMVSDETTISARPYEWKSGTWTHLELSLVKTGENSWEVSGRAWPEGTNKPQAAQIQVKVTEEPPTGRASLWGTPFSSRPIDFDDVVIRRAPGS